MSESTQAPIKPGAVIPAEDSNTSDTARSRSLSPGPSVSRRETETGEPGKAQSKWYKKCKPKQTAASEGDSGDDFADSVSKRVRRRRQKTRKPSEPKLPVNQAKPEGLKEAGLNDADINRISYNMAKHIR